MSATTITRSPQQFTERRGDRRLGGRRAGARAAAWSPALHRTGRKHRARPTGVMAGLLMAALMWALVGGQALASGAFDGTGLTLAIVLTLALLPLAWLERGR